MHTPPVTYTTSRLTDLGEDLGRLRLCDPAGEQRMERSLALHGQLTPLLVRERGSGYEVLDGFKRQRGARSLSWTELQVVVARVNDALSGLLNTLSKSMPRRHRVRSRIRGVVMPAIRPARTRKWIRQTASSGSISGRHQRWREAYSPARSRSPRAANSCVARWPRTSACRDARSGQGTLPAASAWCSARNSASWIWKRLIAGRGKTRVRGQSRRSGGQGRSRGSC
jgi:hypothetical protein